MNKQSRGIYTSLINRIAVAMILNQALITVLFFIVDVIGSVMDIVIGNVWWADMICRLAECIAYALGFCIPVWVFNKMSESAEPEIYTPVKDQSQLSPLQTLLAMLAALGIIEIAAYVNYYAVNLFSDYSDFSAEYMWSTTLDEPYQMIIYMVYVAVIPAVVEELLFRGTVCKSLRTYGDRSAILISAVLFSLMHANAEQAIYTFVAGLLLAWIYVRTENIAFPIVLHFINNGISALSDIIEAQISESAANIFSTTCETLVLLLAAISVLCLAFLFKRSGGFLTRLEMKPDENGNEVIPLSASEKFSGFFTGAMIIFILYSLLTMLIYIALSFTV